MGRGGIYRRNAISQAIKLRRRRRNNISRTFLRSPNSLCALQYYRTPRLRPPLPPTIPPTRQEGRAVAGSLLS